MIGRADVEDGDIPAAYPGRGDERGRAVIDGAGQIPERPDQVGEHLGRVVVVVDDEHAQPVIGLADAPVFAARLGRLRRLDQAPRQANREDRPVPLAGAGRGDLAAVQFDERSHDGQAQPQPAARPVQRLPLLRKEIEDARQHFGLNADARVADLEQHVGPVNPAPDLDPAARLGVLGGVRDEVGEHLGEPLRDRRRR